MNWLLLLQNIMLLFALGASVVAVHLKDLLYAVFILAGATVSLSIVFFLLQAPDVAITNAAVYGGIATVLYVIAISKTERKEEVQ
jgi:multicomponent Na+:H+ antiporter subunit B